MLVHDTSPEIQAMQIQLRRSMTPEQKLRVAFEISDMSRAFRKAGIRRDHPEWSEHQVMIELFRLSFLPKPLPSWIR